MTLPYSHPLIQWEFPSGVGPYDVLWMFCIQCQQFLSTCGACLEVVFEFEWRATYCGSLRAKVILATLGMLKWVRPLMRQYRMFFVVISTLPSSMHQKLTKHERCCFQSNQLPTKSPFKLNSLWYYILRLDLILVCQVINKPIHSYHNSNNHVIVIPFINAWRHYFV